MKKLSIVISAFNEEKHIKECLESVKNLADEIIVVDNSSEDKTSEIAKKYTKKIYTQKNDPKKIDYQKNLGIKKATGDWVLLLDADERVTPELAQEIENKIGNLKLETGNSSVDGYWIPRKNIIFGKWIQNSIWWPDFQLRLFKTGKGEFPDVTVHQPLTLFGETEKLTNPLLHENYQSITQYIQRLDTIYTEREAARIIKSGKKLMWYDAIRFPTQDFLKTYFFQKGYKDGLHGLVLSLLQAFYAEVVFAKVWEAEGFKEENNSDFLGKVIKEFKRAGYEFSYWIYTSYLEDVKNPIKKISYKILKKRAGEKSKYD